MGELQQSLFTGYPATNTATVNPVESVPRKSQRKRAAENVDPAFLERYERVLRTVGQVMSTFGAWDVTAAYERRYAALTTMEKKATGYIYGDLQQRGIIAVAGTGKRPNGNLAATYKLK